MTEWLGLTSTRTVEKVIKGHAVERSILTTDKWAIEHAAEKFGVTPDQIELKRTGGGILLRVRESDESDVEVLSFYEFVQNKYPLPVEGDEFYKTYLQFGYDVFLINAFPEVWKQSNLTWADIRYQERIHYNWYCVEKVMGIREGNITDNALESSLTGQRIVTSKIELQPLESLRLPEKTPGILLWEEGARLFCLFIAGDELLPLLCDRQDVMITDDVFEGWE